MVRAFFELAPAMGVSIVDNPWDANAILVVGMDKGDTDVSVVDACSISASSDHKIKTILRVNENDARKNTTGVDRSIIDALQYVDGAVFVSNWLMNDYFMPKIAESNTAVSPRTVIVNGVDSKIFNPGNLTTVRALSDIPHTRIIAHHWSNNPLKGFDVYEFIDKFCDSSDEFSFHYIGRDRGTFRGRHTYITPPQHGIALGNSLRPDRNCRNVYISASRQDPGPNHIIESIASGLETYVHIDGGGAVEFAGKDHTYRTYDDLLLILMKIQRDGSWLKNEFVPTSWDECVRQYVDYLTSIVAS